MRHYFLVFYLIIDFVLSFSLLDQVNHKDVRTSLPDFRTSDADVGMRSAHFIGSFRGQPIKTRQRHVFIDDNGVPIPLMPYHKRGGDAIGNKSKLNRQPTSKNLKKFQKLSGFLTKRV